MLVNQMRELLKNVFVRDVGVLAGGTGLSQALMVLVLPVLTRLYTPEDFSVLAVYVSVLGIISVAACLRLEIAIPMPRDDGEAANLLALALASSVTIAGTVAIIVFLFPNQIGSLIDRPDLQAYLWLLPLGIGLGSSYSALQYWATRNKRFSSIAKTRLTQAIGGGGTQVLLGIGGVAPFGLLFGHLISSGAGVLALGSAAIRGDRVALRAIRLPTMRAMLRHYDQFPKFSTLDALANSAGMQLPLIIIATMAVGPEAGFLLLVMRTMQAPMSLIGGAVAQVYLSRAPDEFRAGKLRQLTFDVLLGLVRGGVGPLLFLGILAPAVFALVFGEEWRRAGDLVVWMMPWFVLQFISSPISMVMHVRSLQKAMLAITLSGLVIRLGAMGLAARYDQQHFSEYYAISCALFYFGCYWTFSTAAGIFPNDTLRLLRRAALPVACWVVSGVFCRYLMGHVGL